MLITVTLRNNQVFKCLKKTPQIRGKGRASMMEILKHVTPSQIKRNAFAVPRSPSTYQPPPIGTLNNILHVRRGHANLIMKLRRFKRRERIVASRLTWKESA